MQEEWRDIKGYEKLYQISNLGRVKSLERFKKTRKSKKGKNGYILIKEKIKILIKDNKGYLRVGLCKNGVNKTFKVHRLVAETFIPNPDNLPQVNHKDENKQSNIVENLEWCDNSYNVNYGTRNKRSAKSHIGKKVEFDLNKNKKKVLQIDKETDNVIMEWGSITEAQREYGYSHISECCRGRRTLCGGYKWRYAN